MTLDAWLKQTGRTEEAFAADVNTSQKAVNRYRRFQRIPRLDIALRISAATGGQVSFNEMIHAPGAEEPACP